MLATGIDLRRGCSDRPGSLAVDMATGTAPSVPPARRLLGLTWRERALLVEAGVWLAAARLVVVAVPFRWLVPRLGAHMAESPPAGDAARLAGIGWAIRAVATRTPWRSMCLEQAITAKAMLRRRRIPNTLYLGLTRAPAGGERPIVAHAWLRSGDVHVTGGAQVGRYAVVSTFADPG